MSFYHFGVLPDERSACTQETLPPVSRVYAAIPVAGPAGSPFIRGK